MNTSVLDNYQLLVRIDMIVSGNAPKYPYRLNEQAQYTHHQVALYQSNYCHLDTAPEEEQPSVVGGGIVDIVLL